LAVTLSLAFEQTSNLKADVASVASSDVGRLSEIDQLENAAGLHLL